MPPADPNTQRIVINDLAALYTRKLRAEGKSPGTIRYYSQKFAIFHKFTKSKNLKYVDELKPDHIRELLIELQKDHNPGGQHAVFRAVRAMIYWYEAEFEPENWKNPIRHKVKEPKVPEQLLDPIEPEAVEALCATCKRGTFTGDRDRAIFRLLISSGCRAAELISLQIQDINLIFRKARIRHGKGGDAREIYFDLLARKAISAYLKHRIIPKGPLFWSDKDQKPLDYDGLRSAITRHAKLAGLDPIPTAHMFRRAFAKEKLKSGLDLLTVSRLLGHKSLAATRRYLKLTDEDLWEAYDREYE